MRGEHEYAAATRTPESGLIPACAGSTRTAPAGTPAARAHPRLRGEHHCSLEHLVRLRLIPACAGSTPRDPARPIAAPTHPRMRGEHMAEAASGGARAGSSPHARGAHARLLLNLVSKGLIPACAGSTADLRKECTGLAAHPRMRGEHPIGEPRSPGGRGSSPHARGAQRRRTRRRSPARLIPACAGSTSTSHSASSGSWAHPRMRGEHASAAVCPFAA